MSIVRLFDEFGPAQYCQDLLCVQGMLIIVVMSESTCEVDALFGGSGFLSLVDAYDSDPVGGR